MPDLMYTYKIHALYGNPMNGVFVDNMVKGTLEGFRLTIW
jgi:hypothetical protein